MSIAIANTTVIKARDVEPEWARQMTMYDAILIKCSRCALLLERCFICKKDSSGTVHTGTLKYSEGFANKAWDTYCGKELISKSTTITTTSTPTLSYTILKRNMWLFSYINDACRHGHYITDGYGVCEGCVDQCVKRGFVRVDEKTASNMDTGAATNVSRPCRNRPLLYRSDYINELMVWRSEDGGGRKYIGTCRSCVETIGTNLPCALCKGPDDIITNMLPRAHILLRDTATGEVNSCKHHNGKTIGVICLECFNACHRQNMPEKPPPEVYPLIENSLQNMIEWTVCLPVPWSMLSIILYYLNKFISVNFNGNTWFDVMNATIILLCWE